MEKREVKMVGRYWLMEDKNTPGEIQKSNVAGNQSNE